MNAPRVLFFGGTEIGGNDATGQTLALLYSDYPEENVTQFVPVSRTDGGFGHRLDVGRWLLPFRTLYYGGRAVLHSKLRLPPPPPSGHNAISRGSRSLRLRWNDSVAAAIDLSPIRISRRQMAALRASRPDVIHAVVHSCATVRVALRLSKRLRVPLVPQFTDDWMSTIFTGGEMGGWARRRATRLFARLMKRAASLFVIGDAMAAEYASRYGAVARVVAFGVEPSDYRPRVPDTAERKTLLYIGGGYIGRAELIDDVADLVSTYGWRVRVHTAARTRWQPRSEAVDIRDEVSIADLPTMLCGADAMLFVESMREEVAAYTRLSVSTKVPQLIASGRPVLIVGPDGQGSVEELRRHVDRSLHITDLDPAVLGERVRAFLDAVEPTAAEPRIPEQFTAAAMRSNLLEGLRAATDTRQMR